MKTTMLPVMLAMGTFWHTREARARLQMAHGKQLSSSALVKTAGKEDSYLVVEAGSGDYEFTVSR